MDDPYRDPHAMVTVRCDPFAAARTRMRRRRAWKGASRGVLVATVALAIVPGWSHSATVTLFGLAIGSFYSLLLLSDGCTCAMCGGPFDERRDHSFSSLWPPACVHCGFPLKLGPRPPDET